MKVGAEPHAHDAPPGVAPLLQPLTLRVLPLVQYR